MTEPRWYRIVVALDLSEYAEIVLEHALDQAARHDAPDLHFIAVQEAHGAPLDDLKARLAALVYQGLETQKSAASNWRARLHVRAGRADAEIVELALEVNADLVVVGRFGGHRAAHQLGAVAARVVEGAPCPTLVVGLSEHVMPSREACPECEAMREDSAGERWFCAAHVAPERPMVTLGLPMATSWSGGGPMW